MNIYTRGGPELHTYYMFRYCSVSLSALEICFLYVQPGKLLYAIYTWVVQVVSWWTCPRRLYVSGPGRRWEVMIEKNILLLFFMYWAI